MDKNSMTIAYVTADKNSFLVLLRFSSLLSPSSRRRSRLLLLLLLLLLIRAVDPRRSCHIVLILRKLVA
ncbi:hypothetical protein RIF29_36905 [Crotalaria pallida]|uniref:Uncharacterized protein n=1 Tax=Crotalaria pallida TaxID=3830 RepID=A0AAN9EE28_CROPI